MKPLLPSLAPLDDAGLRAELPRVVQSERSLTVVVVARLAEFDERRLYLGMGFSSLFAYCTGVLKLSEDQTYYRIQVARAARRFPEILDRLANGSLTLTTLRTLAPHLGEDNKQLLDDAAGKSKRQVQELVAARLPEQPAVSSVRKLPELPPSRRPVVAPVSADQYRITITASREMRDELARVQDLLRHQIPDGDPGKILARALSLLRQRLEKKKVGAAKPGHSRKTRPGSRHVPAEVRNAVWARDEGRCAFVAQDGRRCADTGGLEFHHGDPHALGGEATVGNMSLRCRAHNAHEAVAWFGQREPARQLVPARVECRTVLPGLRG
jgi:hypothetical protein